MITTASQGHLDGIRALWQQAFGDSLEYINLFLEQYAQPQNTLVYLQNGAVAGMLFILPCHLVFGTSRYRCAYVYGIATRQELRGQGISTQLLQYAHHLCSQRGYAVCALVPATPSLFQFYEKKGFAVQGVVKTLSVDAGELAATHALPIFSAIDSDKVFAMRKDFFGTAYLEWDKPELAYIQTENQFTGGSFYHYDLDGACGYLCCVPHGDTLLVTELAGSAALLPDLLNGLHALYHKRTYHVRLSGAAPIGELTPFAMTKWITKGTRQPFYLSLVLD